MAKISVTVVTLAVLGVAGGLAYVHANRDDAVVAEPPPRAAAPTADESSSNLVEHLPTLSQLEEAPAPLATEDVARWIADTQSNDAKTRATAIEALANAPRAQAIPALERVLESGEPQVDRQIALRSLHILALNDGDDTGAIRDAIRHAMYHSDDEGVTQSAQAFLEDIEAALAEQTGSAANYPARFPLARPSE